MSSILTNTSAMVALQTLKGINTGLEKTQSEISTGKTVASAKDNAAVWAISKTMESDVKGFKGISDSLSLGQSTVAVARQATETITDLLTEVKGKIVAAQEQNVDRAKIQTDIEALTDQIKSVVGAAQFNGMNLIDGTSTDSMSVLSSLDRDASGGVTPKHIDVSRQNLSVTTPASAQSYGSGTLTTPANYISGSGTTQAAGTDALTAAATVAASGTESITIGQVAEGVGYQIKIDGLEINTADGSTATGTRTFEYVASATDGTADVAANLMSQMNAFFEAATGGDYSVAVGGTDNVITITNGSSASIDVGLQATDGGTAGSDLSSGGLGALATMDVTTDSGATGALAAIDTLIEKSTTAAAAFGSAESRLETQSTFISDLTSSMKAGIGSLVDADMEEASARLQALQVQQQLGVQSLSIANQAPQSILSLFR
ncbi:flagellin [Acidimangrovimonas sediminis]|uniref:flagellin n=1 Tax=Acidimangrovimonas sediminis TaxID=2056283 RepID=UPI000C806DD4|nr:flagellin [Acidimangrovimonas sediminis]